MKYAFLVFFALPEPFAHRFGIPCEPAYNPAEDIEFQLELRGIPALPESDLEDGDMLWLRSDGIECL